MTHLSAQSTDISIGATVLQPSVKRFGINLGTLNNYDSGQLLKNLITANPGFEGQIWNSTIRCLYGSATSCTDEDQYSGWPAGLWTGASYEVFYGSAAGRTGIVSSSTAPGYGAGVILNFDSAGAAPSNGDYLIVHRTIPGTSTTGWFPYTSGSGSVNDNLTDLPPGTLGKQTAVLTAPASTDFANLSNFFDSTFGKSFIQLNGTYQLQFKAKGLSGSKQINIQLTRYGVATYIAQAVTLTNNWNTYNLTFTASETGSAVGTVGLSFSTINADSFELDDVSLTPTRGDPANATVFRDPVVNALRTLNPGIIRYWGANGHLGETLDNLLTPQFGRQRANYSAYYTTSQIDYGLHEFLALCQLIGAEPWFVVPTTFTTTDASNLIEYLGGSSSTLYGAKRTALGQTTPWTQVFSKIHLEFGNEAWNGTFKGGTIEYPAPYGSRAQSIFAVMRAHAAYVSNAFDLVLGGQAASPGRNSDIQSNCNNNDSFDIAPYTMNQVDSYSDIESLYGSTFAEPEALTSAAGTTSAENFSPGLIYENSLAIQLSSHPVPISFYEMNLSTLAGGITQQALDSYTPSVGAGLMVVDTMFQSLRQFGVINQSLFALPQYNFVRPDGKSIRLWGSVIDMGVTDRRRPQYLALQLANQALSTSAVMLQTTHTGANPTWNQPLVNTVQINGAHYLQSFAFANGTNKSVVVFNLSRTSTLPVTFSGVNAPAGTVQLQQLTSVNPGDTNETAQTVNIVASTLNGFNPATGLSLPAYSMTTLTWSMQSASQAPVISSVSVSGTTSSSATITWTTDQPSSSQVQYGPTTAFSSSSQLNANLVTTHSVTLVGLTSGITYNFDVTSANSTSLSSTSANFTFATPASAPVISSINVTAVTSATATITWTTDQPASSQVFYGATPAYGSTALNSSLVTSHSVKLSGLVASTTYNFEVSSSNSAGAPATSTNLTFTTAGGPIISGVTATKIAGTSATITWITDQACSSQVQYGVTLPYSSASTLDSTQVTTHSVNLTGLTPSTTYNYAALSNNSVGLSSTSANFTFTTPAQGPIISSVKASSTTLSSAVITWTTDQASSSQVKYGATSAYGSTSALNSALVTAHSVTLTGLASGTVYNYAVVSTNAAGLSTTSSNFTFTTASPGPAPTISYLAFWGVSNSGVAISWSTDLLSTTQLAYGTTTALGQLSPLQTTLSNSHGVTLTGLSGGTTYYFVAQSAGSTGVTGYSTTYTFTTLGSSGLPTISGIVVTPGSNNTAQISWQTSVPTYSYVQYGPTTAYNRYSSRTTLTATPQPALGYVPSGTIHYQLVSTDAAGNQTLSPDYTFVEP